MDKKIHILFLCSWFPNKYVPFLGNFIENHALSVGSYCKISCLYVRANLDQGSTKYEIDFKVNGEVDEWVLYYQNSSNLLVKFWRYMRAHYLGRKLIIARNGKIDGVHLHVVKPAGIVAIIWNLLEGIPFMVTEHSTAYLEMNRTKMGSDERLLAKIVLKRAEMVSVVTRHLGENLKALGKIKKMEVLQNVVDENLFFPATRIEEQKFTFIHISTLVEEHKNAGGILKAFSKLAEERQDVRLWIVSDGDFTYCKQVCKELRLEEKVEFMGPLPSGEIAKKLRQSNCLVLFSNYENMPVVLSEAWMCGLPVISSDVGGIKDYLHPNNGILIKARDEAGLLQAMKTVQQDYVAYNPEEISKFAMAEFSSQSIGIKLKNQYLTIFG